MVKRTMANSPTTSFGPASPDYKERQKGDYFARERTRNFSLYSYFIVSISRNLLSIFIDDTIAMEERGD